MTKSIVTVVIGLLLIAFVYSWWLVYDQTRANVTSFETCVAMGYPVLESYPAQCKTPEGKTFVQDVGITVTSEDRVVTFACDDWKSLVARFQFENDSYVDLTLSDGRRYPLPKTTSGSGARYANGDESVVFWNKGNTAFVTEGKTETYSNCVELE